MSEINTTSPIFKLNVLLFLLLEFNKIVIICEKVAQYFVTVSESTHGLMFSFIFLQKKICFAKLFESIVK